MVWFFGFTTFTVFLFPPPCYTVCLSWFWLVNVKVLIQPTMQLPQHPYMFCFYDVFQFNVSNHFFALRLWQSTHSCRLSTIQPSYVSPYLITLLVILSTFTSSEASLYRIHHISRNSACCQMNTFLHTTVSQNICLLAMPLNLGRKVSLKTTDS